MANKMLDLRRSDLRTSVLENPYWITSKELDHAAADDEYAVFFSFPIGVKEGVVNPSVVYGNNLVLLHGFIIEVTEFFEGGTIAFDIGQYSILTDDLTTLATATLVDLDMYYDNVDGAADLITNVGLYYPGQDGDVDSVSAWLVARKARTWGTNASIIPKDDVVPCITGTLTSNATINQGKLYLHALISVVPVVS